jgi:hypothetical protein
LKRSGKTNPIPMLSTTTSLKNNSGGELSTSYRI